MAKAISSLVASATDWASGSWKTSPTTSARSRGWVVRVSRPATWTRPAKVPPEKWGTSPLRQRSRVDFPEPELPTSSTSSPSPMRRSTSRRAGPPEPG